MKEEKEQEALSCRHKELLLAAQLESDELNAQIHELLKRSSKKQKAYTPVGVSFEKLPIKQDVVLDTRIEIFQPEVDSCIECGESLMPPYELTKKIAMIGDKTSYYVPGIL